MPSNTPPQPEARLPQDLQGLLAGVALYRAFLDADYLGVMAASVSEDWSSDMVDQLLGALEDADVLWDYGSGVFGIDPQLTERLQSLELPPDSRDAWAEQFVKTMSSLAGWLAPLDWNEQRVPYQVHRLNLHQAITHARRLAMTDELLVLLQVSAECARNAGLLDEAAALYDEMLAGVEESGEPEAKAAACHQRGLVAQQQRQYDEAERWYRRALEIEEELGDRHGAAMSEHQIARLEQERGNLGEAESLFLRAVTGLEEAGDTEHASIAWRQLGRLAQDRGDRARAKRLYDLSLERAESSGSLWEQANTLHQLGFLAQQFGDSADAKRFYEQAIEVRERNAGEPSDDSAASYHQLGTLALERGDFGEAEQLLRRSYGSERRQGNDSGAAATVAALALLAAAQGDFAVAGRRLARAAVVFVALGQADRLEEVVSSFRKLWLRATASTKMELRRAWEKAKLDWPDDLE